MVNPIKNTKIIFKRRLTIEKKYIYEWADKGMYKIIISLR